MWLCKKMCKSYTASERIVLSHQQLENGGHTTSLRTQLPMLRTR